MDVWLKSKDCAMLALRGEVIRTKSKPHANCRPGTRAILRTVGHIRVDQRDYTDGLEVYQKSLVSVRSTLGNRHYQTDDCMYNVAQGLSRLGILRATGRRLRNGPAYPLRYPTSDFPRILARPNDILEETGNGRGQSPCAVHARWSRDRTL